MIFGFGVVIDLLCCHRIRPPARRILHRLDVFDLIGAEVAGQGVLLRDDGGLVGFAGQHHADDAPLETVARALGSGHVLRSAAGGVDHHRGPVAADAAQHAAGLAFIEAPQSHRSHLMLAAQTVAVLDEIEIEGAALALRIRLVAPFDRPRAVEIGLGGAGGRNGRADDQCD